MKIAVIGSGISGLTSAHLLSDKHEVTLFESNRYLGGHTNTVTVKCRGTNYRLDTGFIVFNDRTYPLFNRLLAKIGQPFQPSEMSFSVRNLASGLEYNGHNLDTLFAQRRNLLSLSFYRLISEILRFNKQTRGLYENNRMPLSSLGEFLRQENYSDDFCHHYLLPMVAAIWSCSLRDSLAFPVRFFVNFFYHHGLLDIANRPQWSVIQGGSSSYIPALTAPFASRIHLDTPVERVSRSEEGVTIVSALGEQEFDYVVLACHSDQALRLLADPSELETAILSRMSYQPNEVVLHQDVSLMPKNRRAWASWNFSLQNPQQLNEPALVTYYMNRLQGLTDAPDFFVTLNGTRYIDEKKILRRFVYDHPVMDQAMIHAQSQRDRINGKNRTLYCGAYWYNGFHEDGVRSAVEACEKLGVVFE